MKKLLFILCVPLLLYAEPPSELSSDNLSHELIECASFFGIVAVAVENKSKELSQKAWSSFNLMHKYALINAGLTRDKTMAKKVTTARLEMASKDMREDIGDDFSNLSILLNKYNDSCNEWRLIYEQIDSKAFQNK